MRNQLQTRRSLVQAILEVLPEKQCVKLDGLPFNKIYNYNGCLKLDGERSMSLPYKAKKMPPYDVLDEIYTTVLFATTIYGLDQNEQFR